MPAGKGYKMNIKHDKGMGPKVNGGQGRAAKIPKGFHQARKTKMTKFPEGM